MEPEALPQEQVEIPAEQIPQEEEETIDVLEVVERYQKKLQSAGDYSENDYMKRAQRMTNLYELRHYADEGGKETKAKKDRIKVPYPYSNARQILAEVYRGLPPVVVKPTSRAYTEGAPMLKRAIEYCIKRSNLEREAKLSILHGIVTGIGCTQISSQVSTVIPKYTHRPYKEFLYDAPNVLSISDSNWIAFKTLRSKSDVENDTRYNEEYRMKVQPGVLDTKIYQGNPDDQPCIIWTVLDKKEDLIVEFPDDQKLPLRVAKMSDVYKFDLVSDDFKYEWPAAWFVNEEMLTSASGLGDVYPIESQVRELDKTRSQQVNHRKRFDRKYVVSKTKFDAAAMNQLKNGGDGAIIEVNDPVPSSTIFPVIDAPMSSDVYRVDTIIQNDIQITSPLGPNSLTRGIGDGPDTLGEAQIVAQASNTRLADKQKNVATYFTTLYRMTAQYIQQHWTEKMEILISGDGSKESDWLNFDPEMVAGEYMYDVEPESMQDNTAVYRKQYAEAINMVVPLLPVIQQNPGVGKLVRNYLMQFETLKNMVDDIIPEPVAPGEPVDEELQGLLGGEDESAIVDTINQLPDNEREILTNEINKAKGAASVGAPQTPQVNI